MKFRLLDDHAVNTLRACAKTQGLSLEQSLRNLLAGAARIDHSLREGLTRVRATTPVSDRNLGVAALIRAYRDGR